MATYLADNKFGVSPMLTFNRREKSYADENGNKVYIKHFKTKTRAKEALRSLVNCRNCTNCWYCEHCVDCVNCQGCQDCNTCTDCLGCNRCDYCYNVHDKADGLLQQGTPKVSP
jgi:hypothetical protein